MRRQDLFDPSMHDPEDPNPWSALYLDRSIPIVEAAKRAWLLNLESRSRQFLLPVVRPFARAVVVFLQLIKIVIPNRFTSSRILHLLLSWGLRTWVSPQANFLILRHFHIGSESLSFIAKNIKGVNIETTPLRPQTFEDIKDHTFLKHDLNLYNFIIRLNRELREKNIDITPQEELDFEGITDGPMPIEELPNRWTNFLDLETAIELFTPVYQLFLTDNDFWRASNSLQLDETIGLYVSQILGTPWNMMLVNNKHPMVPESTLKAGYRLVLHGLSSESLHAILVDQKRKHSMQGGKTRTAGGKK